LRNVPEGPCDRSQARSAWAGVFGHAESSDVAEGVSFGPKGQENLAPGLPWVLGLSREALKGRADRRMYFVPEGQHESSQARSAWGQRHPMSRPVWTNPLSHFSNTQVTGPKRIGFLAHSRRTEVKRRAPIRSAVSSMSNVAVCSGVTLLPSAFAPSPIMQPGTTGR
jgi:hypothetical protein